LLRHHAIVRARLFISADCIAAPIGDAFERLGFAGRPLALTSIAMHHRLHV
jgi:hypothetical protein